MEILNNHVYLASYVEKWLSESAGLERGSRKWKKVLNRREPIVLNPDEFLFERVSETHYRAHRVNAKKAAELKSLLQEATWNSNGSKSWVRSLAIVVAIAGTIGIAALVRDFVLNSH
ncbi:hypothetical protein [Xanthomonas albilineans]|uniref:hypothetical protein n=1 Tax=Xanthomonas albilineans TaxID=29447 RepID=UPI0005F328C3|nr:hypothetical protein [Xanthomonas albilineans]